MKAFLSKGQAATEMHKPTRTPGIEREQPWKDPPIFKNGKPSISIRAIYTMAMLNSQRVNCPFSIAMLVYWRVLLRIS
jgi:hypothetical protein